VAEPPEREVAVEQVAPRFDDGEGQDQEAPHGEEVGNAGYRPLEQLALAGDLGDLGVEPTAEFLDPTADRLAGADQPVEPQHAPAGDGQADSGDHQADDESQNHEFSRFGGLRCRIPGSVRHVTGQ
jgi:hypothetical protein